MSHAKGGGVDDFSWPSLETPLGTDFALATPAVEIIESHQWPWLLSYTRLKY